jgi:hypothetical protein
MKITTHLVLTGKYETCFRSIGNRKIAGKARRFFEVYWPGKSARLVVSLYYFTRFSSPLRFSVYQESKKGGRRIIRTAWGTCTRATRF